MVSTGATASMPPTSSPAWARRYVRVWVKVRVRLGRGSWIRVRVRVMDPWTWARR